LTICAKLAGMSFDESFWVVVGTAAPIIALAAVISVNDTARTQFAVSDASTTVLATVRGDETDGMYRLLDKRANSLVAVRVAQLSNLCLQAVLLAVSLLSLSFARNLIPAWICVVVPAAGVLLFAYAGLTVTKAQELTRSQRPMLDQQLQMAVQMKILGDQDNQSKLTNPPDATNTTGADGQSGPSKLTGTSLPPDDCE
jgi:hypothetical protein